MKFRITLILLLTSVFCRLNAQDNYFMHYGQANGLNNSFVYAINQDADGYLLVGTGEGLYRFNGFEFQHFTDQDSLAENFITTIYKDLSGRMWLGHKSGGITQISNNRFRIVSESSAYNSAITSITEADSGAIWFSTQNEGFMVLYSDNNAAQVSTTLKNDPVSVIRHISGNFFLIGTQENLYVMEYLKSFGSMAERLRISNYPMSKVVEIIEERKGEYLIFSQDDGIYRLSLDDKNKAYDLKLIMSNTIGQLDNIQGARFAHLNELWVYTMGNGIIKYILENESGNYIAKGSINITNGLISNNVKCIFEDIEGNIWVGMFGDDLLRLADDNLKFYSYLNTIASNNIYSLANDSNNIWLASDDCITIISADEGLFRNSFRFPLGLSGAKLNTIYYSNAGLVYMGFEKEGMYTFDLGKEKFVKIFLSKDDLENSINHITGKGNFIWISTKKGICKLNTLTGARRWFTTNDGLPHNNIQELFIDSKGRVLVATICKNIFFIDEDNKVAPLNNTNKMGLNSVISIAEDNRGSLWAATQGNGVYMFSDGDNQEFTRSSGLLSDYSYCLLFDGKQNILVSHRGGFSQINVETMRVKNYSRSEGLKSSSDFFPNAALTDTKNNVWFGTSEGIVKFVPKVKAKKLTPPFLHINALYIDKKKVNFKQAIVLKPGYYEIEVEYTGISFSNPELIEYQTFLEGYSMNWSDLSNKRSVIYERVGHGEYTFMLRAYNENDIPNVNPLSFNIKIKNPYYLSFWFYLLIITMLGISLFQYIKIREKKMRTTQERLIKNLDEKSKEIIVKEEIIKERRKVEKVLIEAKERAELSDKLKSSFLTNISHEIRTPMNAIVGLSELLKVSGYSEEERVEFVDMILSNSISLLNLIDDILDISKIESNQLKVNFSIFRVYDILEDLQKRYSEELRAREKFGVELHLSLDSTDVNIVIETDSMRLKQVISKLLDNAVKFTDSGIITFGFKKATENIIFFVEDTGIGLSEDKREIIFELFRKVEDNKLRLYRGTGLGLSLSQNIVKLMGGEIKVESEEGKGSRFYFSLPINRGNIIREPDMIKATGDKRVRSWSQKTILVVEDEISNFILLREILKSSGVNIVNAVNGLEAVGMLSAVPKPDLIIMDIKLPGIDGYEVTRQIRELNMEIPIIAHTAYAMAGDYEKAIEAGCNDYISKPTDKELLFKIIDKYF